jgi:Cu(I)/Ag(I) efflux system membrane fusion protein
MSIDSTVASEAKNLRSRHSLRSRLVWIGRRLLPLGVLVGALVLLIIAIGVAQRAGWIGSASETSSDSAVASTVEYTCPMHPQIRQPNPGRCPICGMELVPASAGVGDLGELAVKIEPAQRRLANIQTAEVERSPLEATLQSVGVIAIDESRQATIAAYVDGRLERLFADYTGVEIKKGDHLAVIYSPQLYGAQVEYLEARRAISGGGLAVLRQAQEALVTNTRQRLREFGVTDDQLAELERSGKPQSRLTIYAPQGGTVVEKPAVEGAYVKAGDPIYRIAELSTVWLMLKLFPEDATRIRFGQQVEAVVQSLPGEKLIGRVAFVDPTVDRTTRTVGVRVELFNDGRLRPGDYAEASITLPIGPHGKVYDAELAGKWISPMHPQIIRDKPGKCPICGMELVSTSRYGFTEEPVQQPESLHVPRSAVLLAGGNSVVYVESKPGVFEIRPVTVGPILRDKIVVLDGLRAGEKVATAGNFLIDSQMQLAGKPSVIDPARAVANSTKSNSAASLESISVTAIDGESGKLLETLYSSYFEIQKALAADSKPPAAAAQALHHAAATLGAEQVLPAAAMKHVKEIADGSQHLHHLALEDARKAFQPVSEAVVALAAQVRSADSQVPFTQFFCPMVPGGGANWLQADGHLLNPYFGSKMLRCGEKVKVLPPASHAPPQSNDNPQGDAASQAREGA